MRFARRLVLQTVYEQIFLTAAQSSKRIAWVFHLSLLRL